jgi:hypothetical protein
VRVRTTSWKDKGVLGFMKVSVYCQGIKIRKVLKKDKGGEPKILFALERGIKGGLLRV